MPLTVNGNNGEQGSNNRLDPRNSVMHYVEPPMRFLHLKVHSCMNLPPLEKKAKQGDKKAASDAYTIATLGSIEVRTKVRPGTNDPKWHETFVVPIPQSSFRPDTLKLRVCGWNKSVTGDKFYGSLSVPINELPTVPVSAPSDPQIEAVRLTEGPAGSDNLPHVWMEQVQLKWTKLTPAKKSYEATANPSASASAASSASSSSQTLRGDSDPSQSLIVSPRPEEGKEHKEGMLKGVFRKVKQRGRSGSTASEGALSPETVVPSATSLTSIDSSQEVSSETAAGSRQPTEPMLICWTAFFDDRYLATPPKIGTLNLNVLSCEFRTPDHNPFVVARFGQNWTRLPTKMRSIAPTWGNHPLSWPITDPTAMVTLAVFDDKAAQGSAQEEEVTEGGLQQFVGKPKQGMIEQVQSKIQSIKNNNKKPVLIGRTSFQLNCLYPNHDQRTAVPLYELTKKHVVLRGYIHFQVRAEYPEAMPYLRSYARPELPPHYYYQPVPNDLSMKVYQQEAVLQHLETQSPPIPREVSEVLYPNPDPKADPKVLKYQAKRVRRIFDLFRSGYQDWKNLTHWKNPTKSAIANVVWLFLVYVPYYIPTAICLWILWVLTWSPDPKSISTPKYPDEEFECRPPPPDPNAYGLTLIDPHADESEKSTQPLDSFEANSARNEMQEVMMKFLALEQTAGNVQKHMGTFSTNLERVEALFSRQDPTATKIMVALVIIFPIAQYLFGIQQIMALLGMVLLRHPMLRKPTPPLPLTFLRHMTDRTPLVIHH